MRELPIPQEVTAENYWPDLRDASLYGDGGTLEKPDIPAQPKLSLADQGHYVAGLRNIPLPLEAGNPVRNWRPEVGDDVSSGSDYEARIVCRDPKLMWFHIAPSEGFFATDAARLDMCLSDTYYVEDVDRIPREPTQPIPPGRNPGEEHQSDVEESSESSSSESDEENSDAEKLKNRADNGNQSANEAGNGGDPAYMLNADDLLRGQNLPEMGDGNVNEAEQNPSQGTGDEAANVPANQASMANATSQVAAQPFPPSDPLEPLQPTPCEHWQSEQPQEQVRSNGQEQVQVVLDTASRQSTTDLDESPIPLRIVESEEAEEKRAKEQKENRESKEKKKKEEK